MDDTRKSGEAADNETSRREIIPLSEGASRTMIESFFNPREPNAALRRAQQRHAALIVSSES